MTARYDLNAPIKTLFEHITDGVAYSDTALLCVAKTGVFHNDLKEWNRKPPLIRDWKNFRLHFAKAHREWKANLLLTSGQHFPRAGAVDAIKSTSDEQYDTV